MRKHGILAALMGLLAFWCFSIPGARGMDGLFFYDNVFSLSGGNATPMNGLLDSGAVDGIWKDAGPTMNFFVQTYAPGSALVIATPDLGEFYVFQDDDVSDGIDAFDLAGQGHHLTMTFLSETQATAVMTPAGLPAQEYSITQEFGILTEVLYDGIWKSPSCETPAMNYYVQTYSIGSAIAIVTENLEEIRVFLESDVASGFDAPELSGKPYRLMLGFDALPPPDAQPMARCFAAPYGTTADGLTGYASLVSWTPDACDVDADTVEQWLESIGGPLDVLTGMPNSVLDLMLAIVQGLLGGGEETSCPLMTVAPPFDLSWLIFPPSVIDISLDFGSGCTFQDETYSGSMILQITGFGIAFEPTVEMTGAFSAAFTDLKGESTSHALNGTVSGNLQMGLEELSESGVGGITALFDITSSDMSLGSHTVTGGSTISFSLSSLTGAGQVSALITSSSLVFDGKPVSGSLGLDGSMEEISEEESYIDLDLTFDHFGSPDLMLNGTGTVQGTLGSTSTLDLAMEATGTDAAGSRPIQVYMTLLQSPTEALLNTTPGPTSIWGNAVVTMEDVILATTEVCDYPTSGLILFQCPGLPPTSVTFQGCHTPPVIQ